MLTLLASAPAHAEAPWSQGVSTDAQVRARTAYNDGKALFENGSFAQAITILRRSLVDLDHPATRFLLAKGLFVVDDMPEALVEFWSAMRHGGQPLDADDIVEIKRFTSLLLTEELGVLFGRLPQGPVVVDGQMVSASGQWLGVVRAGTHQVGPHQVTVAAGHRVDLGHGVASRPLDDAMITELQLALVGFEVRYPNASPPTAPARTRSPAMPVSLDAALPPAVRAICEKATGALVSVCRQYEADRAELVRALYEAQIQAYEAFRHLRKLTSGNITVLP